jgi:hypothetical protein
MEKNELRRIEREVRRVLWEVWDPIDGKQLGGADDEYDAYVGDVVSLLCKGSTDEQIAQQLLKLVTENMQLSRAQVAEMYPTVAALKSIHVPETSSRG